MARRGAARVAPMPAEKVHAVIGRHRHDSPGHVHGVNLDADSRRVGVALVLIVSFMAFEVVVGVLGSSLALLSDAGHMLTDAGVLGLSLLRGRVSKANRQSLNVEGSFQHILTDPLRLHRHRHSQGGHPHHRLPQGRRDRVADRRRPHVSGGVGVRQGVGTDLPRARAAGRRARRIVDAMLSHAAVTNVHDFTCEK